MTEKIACNVVIVIMRESAVMANVVETIHTNKNGAILNFLCCIGFGLSDKIDARPIWFIGSG